MAPSCMNRMERGPHGLLPRAAPRDLSATAATAVARAPAHRGDAALLLGVHPGESAMRSAAAAAETVILVIFVMATATGPAVMLLGIHRGEAATAAVAIVVVLVVARGARVAEAPAARVAARSAARTEAREAAVLV